MEVVLYGHGTFPGSTFRLTQTPIIQNILHNERNLHVLMLYPPWVCLYVAHPILICVNPVQYSRMLGIYYVR